MKTIDRIVLSNVKSVIKNSKIKQFYSAIYDYTWKLKEKNDFNKLNTNGLERV
jgi:hypothetical protein